MNTIEILKNLKNSKIRKQSIHNAFIQNRIVIVKDPENYSNDIMSAIDAFSWEDTQEGFTYWHDIFKYLSYGTL
jgi:hypothetical protein